MISFNVRIPSSLKIKLSKYHFDTKVRVFVNETADDALRFVKHYGIGTSGGKTPTGGAPIWQGKVGSKKSYGKGSLSTGHYRGYLSESHYIVRENAYHVQIVSSAEFVNGVLEGYSTNWSGITFGANNYPKRAIDTLFRTNSIAMNWQRAEQGVKR